MCRIKRGSSLRSPPGFERIEKQHDLPCKSRDSPRSICNLAHTRSNRRVEAVARRPAQDRKARLRRIVRRRRQSRNRRRLRQHQRSRLLSDAGKTCRKMDAASKHVDWCAVDWANVESGLSSRSSMKQADCSSLLEMAASRSIRLAKAMGRDDVGALRPIQPRRNPKRPSPPPLARQNTLLAHRRRPYRHR